MRYGKPHKLLLVSTGNVSNAELLTLFDKYLPQIAELFDIMQLHRSEPHAPPDPPMSHPDEAIPLPPIGPPPVSSFPRPFRAPVGVRLPSEASFPAEVPQDDLLALAEGVVRRVLGHGVPFDRAIAAEFVGGLENEYWGSTSGTEGAWASALVRTDLLDDVLGFLAYVDDQGFVVSRDEVRERMRAIVMGEELPVPNDFVWSRDDSST